MRSSTGAAEASFAAAAVAVAAAFSLASMGWASLESAENTYVLAENGPASQVGGPGAMKDVHFVTDPNVKVVAKMWAT
jgi:hypothetical protein